MTKTSSISELERKVIDSMTGKEIKASGMGRHLLEKNWKPDGLSSVFLASIHAYRNEKDAAFEWLEKAFQERASFLMYLKIVRYFDNLHGDPRFDDLVKRIGIPD